MEFKTITKINTALLSEYIRTSSGEIQIWFGVATEQRPHAEYGCRIKDQLNGYYAYTLEGHGIGSNQKSDAMLEETISRIFSDCQRFSGSDAVTIEITSRQA